MRTRQTITVRRTWPASPRSLRGKVIVPIGLATAWLYDMSRAWRLSDSRITNYADCRVAVECGSPSPATEQNSLPVSASLSHKGRGGIGVLGRQREISACGSLSPCGRGVKLRAFTSVQAQVRGN